MTPESRRSGVRRRQPNFSTFLCPPARLAPPLRRLARLVRARHATASEPRRDTRRYHLHIRHGSPRITYHGHLASKDGLNRHLAHERVLERKVISSGDQKLVLQMLRWMEILARRLFALTATLRAARTEQKRDTHANDKRSGQSDWEAQWRLVRCERLARLTSGHARVWLGATKECLP